MDKLNCWEFHKCGRQPGGERVEALGECIAAVDRQLNGVNNGTNGGRACWAAAGTLRAGPPICTLAKEHGNCLTCEFFRLVTSEESFGSEADAAAPVLAG
jgi:hypothetical protein